MIGVCIFYFKEHDCSLFQSVLRKLGPEAESENVNSMSALGR